MMAVAPPHGRRSSGYQGEGLYFGKRNHSPLDVNAASSCVFPVNTEGQWPLRIFPSGVQGSRLTQGQTDQLLSVLLPPGRLPVAHLLQNARRELHGLVVLLLQHVHVQVVQKVVSVVVQPALVQLGESSSQHASIPLLSFSQFAIFKNSHFLGEKHFQGSLPCCLALD